MVFADRFDSSLVVRRFKMPLEMLVIDTSIGSVDEVVPERHDLER